MIIEIWRVHDGLVELGGMTAHEWWEIAGGAAGLGIGGSAGAVLGAGIGSAAGAARGGMLGMLLGPLGWWWGAAVGAAAGATTGAALMSADAAMRAAQWAAAVGRQTSEEASRRIGTYNEIIATTPVRYAETNFSFVMNAYTDSGASLVGEWFHGWGYRKSRAFGIRAEDGALEVGTGTSNPALRMITGDTVPSPDVQFVPGGIATALSRPLLGLIPPDRLTISFLDRSFEDQKVRLTATSVRLESTDSFLAGLPGISSDIQAAGNEQLWGAFSVTGLPVTLSYPWALT